MPRVCVVGIPVQLRARFEATANQRRVTVTSVIVAVGKEGRLEFRPDRDQAVETVRSFFDSLGEEELGRVVVLPYTPLHTAMANEVQVLADLGSDVVWVDARVDRWPATPPLGGLSQGFLDDLYAALVSLLPGEHTEEMPPSAYFRRVAAQSPRLLIADGALDLSDEVAKHRYKFMRQAADAFEAFLRVGSGGRIDAHFYQYGLGHAQSGGVNAKLTVVSSTGAELHSETSNAHLKQGDKTTRRAAARIYYQAFSVRGVSYVAVLYAGPHPDADIDCLHQLPVEPERPR